MRTRPPSVLGAIAVAGLLHASPAAAVGLFVPLGDLPGGGVRSDVYGLSGDGSVVVGSSNASAGTLAVRWEGGSMLTFPSTPTGAVPQTASKASFDGDVIVGGVWRWDAGVMSNVVGPAGEIVIGVSDVSDDGAAVIGSASEGIGFVNDGGTVTQLGFLPGHTITQPVAISGDGTTIVGRSSLGGLDARGYVWEGGVLTDLGSFFPRALTDDGEILFGEQAGTAHRWEVGVATALETPVGHTSNVNDVTPDGTVAVGWNFSGSRNFAAVWVDGDYVRLTNYVDDFGVVVPTGWQLTHAVGISEDGNVIAGNGINPSGQVEGWLIYLSEPVPQPPGLAAVALTLPLAGALRRALRRR